MSMILADYSLIVYIFSWLNKFRLKQSIVETLLNWSFPWWIVWECGQQLKAEDDNLTLDSRPTPSTANDPNVTLGSMSLAAFSSFQIAGTCHNACCDGFLIGQPLRDFERPK